MQKNYKNKEIKEGDFKNKKTSFFFLKEKPPITIDAETIEEAEEQLQVNKKKNNE